jgi:hypothetical protein
MLAQKVHYLLVAVLRGGIQRRVANIISGIHRDFLGQ